MNGATGETCDDGECNCGSSPCNQNGAIGEICTEGICNCGDSPCGDQQLCNVGSCEGMYCE